MSVFYIVATPIGNLKDISFRALSVFKEVDLILAEDTRVTKKLLSHFQIQKPIKRYKENFSVSFLNGIKNYLENNKRIALVTDAGTPNVSDLGFNLVRILREEMPFLKIIPIPGPSALVTALSVSGINGNRFTFLGYPPHKKGREKFFGKLKEIEVRPIIIFEAKHRLLKTLNSLYLVFGGDYKIFVARELTKIYEELVFLTLSQALIYFQGQKSKGEFVLIVP